MRTSRVATVSTHGPCDGPGVSLAIISSSGSSSSGGRRAAGIRVVFSFFCFLVLWSWSSLIMVLVVVVGQSVLMFFGLVDVLRVGGERSVGECLVSVVVC